jgi:HlyD family type I secretion membrane fusion protein
MTQMSVDVPRWRGGLPVWVGVLALVGLLGGVGYWSVSAQLAGAVVTSGLVTVESNRQAVQHPEGGVIDRISVKEGDRVAAGEVLLVLDGTRLRSELAIVEGQLRELAARETRLEAERDGHEALVFAPELLDLARDIPDYAAQLEAERVLFQARRETLVQEIALLEEQNAQIENRVAGIEAQIGSLDAQLDLIGSELVDQEELLNQRLTQAARVLELRRERAGLEGQRARLSAEIAELRGQAAGNKIAMLQLDTQRREEAVTQLRDQQFQQIDFAERRLSLLETLSRLEVRAPMGGLIYDLQVFAQKAVVQPAQELMQIVPQDQPLVVSSRVNPINIDEVHIGQEAVLRFSAFDQRTTPEIRGAVTRISADVLTDEATGELYYAVEILPHPAELEKIGDLGLLPGMPVEAFLQTGERTALAYLTQPLMIFFNRAFRE